MLDLPFHAKVVVVVIEIGMAIAGHELATAKLAHESDTVAKGSSRGIDQLDVDQILDRLDANGFARGVLNVKPVFLLVDHLVVNVESTNSGREIGGADPVQQVVTETGHFEDILANLDSCRLDETKVISDRRTNMNRQSQATRKGGAAEEDKVTLALEVVPGATPGLM